MRAARRRGCGPKENPHDESNPLHDAHARAPVRRLHDVKKARESEAEWAKAIGDAFAERVAGKFPGGGEPVKVDIAVIDLDPGSKAARFWVGYGAGTGMIVADVTVAGHGSFRISGKITGGWFGGSFLGILRKLGREIADHLAERAGR